MLANPITNISIRKRIKKDINFEMIEEIFSIKSPFILSNLSLKKDDIESISLSILMMICFLSKRLLKKNGLKIIKQF